VGRTRRSERRRLAVLQALSTCASDARSPAEAARSCAATLQSNPDLPFAAIYRLLPEEPCALRVAATHEDADLPARIPVTAAGPWRFAEALEREETILVRLGGFSPSPPASPPAEPGRRAALVPLVEPHGSERLGVLVAGLRPLLSLDESTLAWLRLVASGIAGALARGQAREAGDRQAAALEESERRFAGFMTHLPGLAWIKDADGRYVFVNEPAARAFGRFSGDLLGRTDEEIFPPATAAEFRRNDARARTGSVAVETLETLEHEDGVHHSLVSKFPIPTERGQSLIGGIAIDITDLKRSERSLLEADRHKDEFLATLAHELRNPLAPLRNGLEAIRIAGSADANVLAQARGIMERQLERMVRLIDDLLDLSRISRGNVELRKERVGLAAVLDSALETMKPALDASGRSLVVLAPEEPLHVEGDLTRLAQIVANLLDNAIKYTDAGGHIRLHARREGAFVLVCVSDDGIGISKDALPRVFAMFTQGDRPAGAARGGLGVGLSIARKLVALHGGTIEARSEGPGRGAEFVVRLPVVGPPVEPSARAKAPAPPPPSPRRILVVDDNEDSAESLALVLQMKGNDVRTAQDGPEALGLAEEFRPQLIFLDIGLPGEDGHSVCRRIRALSWGRDLPIVALTGWGHEEDRERSREAGFTCHLVKPADPATLDRLLARLPECPPPFVGGRADAT
jgi:PAS domain S-box-containing protein